MKPTNPKVDAFLSQAKKWQKEMQKLRAILLECGLTEDFKWYQPCYTVENKNVIVIGAFKEHCALLVFKGALLKDPKGILFRPTENTQAGRQIRFTSVRQIAELAPALKGYIREAMEVEKAGLKVTKTTKLVFPEEFQNKLKENAALKAAFSALTPGRQRAYNLHWSAPKQSKTRESRIEKCMPRILQGKGLND